MELTKEIVDEILLNAEYKQSSSKKYKKLPHAYTLREKWDDDELFWNVCRFIRANGIKKPFFRTYFVYYELGEYQYWVMNDEIENQNLINRGEITRQNFYKLKNGN